TGTARLGTGRFGKSRSARTPEELAAIVRRRTGERIDPVTNTMISAFGVRRRTAERMVDGRVVLIGDAAHEVSPIGGQGMTLGWLDALALAPLLEDAVQQDLRCPLHLLPRFRRFEREQLCLARGAGRLAHVNMALGRPLPVPLVVLRDAALRAVLATPMRHGLARAYSMAWADGPPLPRWDGRRRAAVRPRAAHPGGGGPETAGRSPSRAPPLGRRGREGGRAAAPGAVGTRPRAAAGIPFPLIHTSP